LGKFEVLLAGMDLLAVDFPLDVNGTLPPDEKYIYLGTFVFTWKGSKLTCDSIRRDVDLVPVQKFISKSFGPSAKVSLAFFPEMSGDMPNETDDIISATVPAAK
jgi:hypothetical protein